MSGINDLLYYPMITHDDVESGTCCAVCSRPFRFGEPYSERLYGLFGNAKAIIDILCVYCVFDEEPAELDLTPGTSDN